MNRGYLHSEIQAVIGFVHTKGKLSTETHNEFSPSIVRMS